MNEDRATRYHRRRRRFGAASAGLTVALLVALIVTPGARALVEIARQAIEAAGLPAPHRWLPACAVLLLGLLNEILIAPVEFLGGFVLDRRYGLATLSAWSWLRDHLLARMLGLGLAALAASGTYAAASAWPEWWWLVCGVLFALSLLGFTILAPLTLLPLFYRVEPVDREALRTRLAILADRAGTAVLGVYAWKIGNRTKRANAALVGLFGTRRILVSDTMLDGYSDDEIEVVLAHELAHHVHGDIWTTFVLEGLVAVAALFAANWVLATVGPVVGVRATSDVVGLPLVLLAIGGVSWLCRPAASALSRRHERAADRYALAATGNPAAFISAMRRLGVQNLAEETPSRLVRWFCFSHPPLTERIAAAQAVGRP